MPRATKYAKRGKSRVATRATRFKRNTARVRKGKRPTGRVRRGVGDRAPIYPFSRNVSTLIQPWDAGVPTDAFRLNNDSTFYIMSMRLRLSDLPDYEEFQNLFSMYKLASWTTRITPTFKDNMPFNAVKNADGSWNQINPAVPNIECFIIPATYHVHPDQRNWGHLSGHEIQDILNQSQIKSRRMLPSKGFKFNTPRPMIAKTGFVPAKTDSAVTATETHLGTAPWLENGPGPHHGGAVNEDQRLVTHYGFDVLFARVDRGTFTEMQPYHETQTGGMKWRVDTQARMLMRKVR